MEPTSPASLSAMPVPDVAPELAGRLVAGLQRIEDRLEEQTEFDDRFARSLSRHLLEAGGKRVRPVLVLLTAELGAGITDAVIDSATAIELTHLASLYHDDVMDEAATRRGAPAAHRVWGNNAAIMAGDLLFARAARLTSGLGAEAVHIQASTFERLVLGQLHETLGPSESEPAVDHYLSVLSDKTGSLISAACRYGALFGQCDASVREAVVAYGEAVGIAFQLEDDVVDLRSDAGALGKQPGTDLLQGVPTMPVLLVEGGAYGADPGTERLLTLLDGGVSEKELVEVLALFRVHPALSDAQRMAADWARRAVEALSPVPDGDAKRALVGFAQDLVHRDR